ncbi:hypothetical protein BH09GEM1_BH09GEM1_06550 [soil metagenome]
MPPRRSIPRPTNNATRPVLVVAATPVVMYALWTQEQAAAFVNASPRYLRDSSCPKVELPGNGPKGESLLRYKPEDVGRWVDSWGTRSITHSADKDAA